MVSASKPISVKIIGGIAVTLVGIAAVLFVSLRGAREPVQLGSGSSTVQVGATETGSWDVVVLARSVSEAELQGAEVQAINLTTGEQATVTRLAASGTDFSSGSPGSHRIARLEAKQPGTYSIRFSVPGDGSASGAKLVLEPPVSLSRPAQIVVAVLAGFGLVCGLLWAFLTVMFKSEATRQARIKVAVEHERSLADLLPPAGANVKASGYWSSPRKDKIPA